MNDAVRILRCSTPTSSRSARALRRTIGPAVAMAALIGTSIVPFAHPVAADSLSSIQAQASALEAKIQQTGTEIANLNEQYDGAQYHLQQVQSEVASTQAAIARTKASVSKDKVSLRQAAINAYVDNGAESNANPLFASDQKTYAAQAEYGQIVQGTLGTAVANLTNSQDRLNAQESQLQSQESQAQAATNSARQALSQAQSLQSEQSANLAQDKGQIAHIIAQQEAAAAAAKAAAERTALAQAHAAAATAASTPAHGSGSSSSSGGGSTTPIPAPPSDGGQGGAAVAAAESQIGVPYHWDWEYPKGSAHEPGFDCSGLTEWAWGQAGVSLPHFSGDQMSDSTPVPVSDLEPGDLLFYGPGGSDHVAMYIGGGEMIQAPYTGAFVSIAPAITSGSWFAGAGRP